MTNEMAIVQDNRLITVRFLDEDVRIVSNVYPIHGERAWACSACVGGVWLHSAAYPSKETAEAVQANLMEALNTRWR